MIIINQLWYQYKCVHVIVFVCILHQGCSQDYTKGDSEFSRPLLSTDRFTDKKLGHQKWCAPSCIWLFTLYCKNKVISYVCMLNAKSWCLLLFLQLSCKFAKITYRSARAWLANYNYLNPLAKYYFWYLVLHMKVAEKSFLLFIRTWPRWKPCLPLVISSFKSMVLFQGFHCSSLHERIFTTHTVFIIQCPFFHL